MLVVLTRLVHLFKRLVRIAMNEDESTRCRGRKAVTIYLDTAGHRQLRLLALEQSRSVQDLMTEATKDLFQKHGKARIAN